MSEQFWWYLSRASGIVAWVLLVASVIWGVLLVTRAMPDDRPGWLLELHRWLAGLAVTATGLHLLGLVADNFVRFTAADLLVPFASSWKTGPVAIGIVAFYLIVLVQVSSLLRRRLPRRVWRGIHFTSYASVWLVSVHAGLAGTDRVNRLYQFVALLLTTSATAALVIRLLHGKGRRAATRRTEPADV
jgi:predicted ferric reductase